MLEFPYGAQRITIADDPAYSAGSADKVHTYTQEYFFGDRRYTPFSRHGVRVSRDKNEIACCILLAVGGGTVVHEHSAVVVANHCVVAVSRYMVSLSLPRLDLEWAVEIDFAACLGVYHSAKHCSYVSHGEVDIARVSYEGEIIWRYTGGDIFTKGFALSDDCVEAIDWNNTRYRIAMESGQGTVVTSELKRK